MAVSLRFDILRHLALHSSYCNWYTFNQQLPIRLRFISVLFANISPSIATWAMKRNQLYIWADNQLFVNCVQLGLNCRVRQLRRAPSMEHSSQKVSRSNFVWVWMFAQSSFRNSANKWFCREDRLQSETNTLLTVFHNVLLTQKVSTWWWLLRPMTKIWQFFSFRCNWKKMLRLVL